MKTKDQILSDLIADTVAQTNKLTFFGKNSVIRAIYSAIAFALSELWYDLFQLNRGAHIQTAKENDLDILAEREGITRRGATKSTVICVFNGAEGTIIPAGTIIKSNVSGVQYETKNEIVLGRNSAIVRPLFSNVLGDMVIAESLNSGSGNDVGVGELTSIVPEIVGVTVTNLSISSGGLDKETDEEFRRRILDTYKGLNQGTVDFYRATARIANANVLHVLPKFNYRNNGVDLYLLKNSLGVFTANELTAIEEFIYPKQRAMQPIKCYNAVIKALEFQVNLELKQGHTLENILKEIALKISETLDNRNLGFGATVNYYDLFLEVSKIVGIRRLFSFTLNNDTKNIVCNETEVPKFATLLVIDSANTRQLDVEQNYIIVE